MISYPILIADDDVEDHLMLQEYFNDIELGHAVRFFENGQKVIGYLEELTADELPRLIVLDLNMPILNGTQTLLQIRRNAQFNNIPIIIFSTSANDNEKRKCLSYGAIDYLVKPMSMAEGAEIVRKFASFI